LIKTFRTSLPEAGDAEKRDAAADQVRDSTPSNACAMKMPAPTRPITAVTISNIANILCAPHEQNDAQARTVKRISWRRGAIGADWGFGATECAKTGQAKVAIVTQKQRLSNHRDTGAKPTPFPPCSPCGIFSFLMQRWGLYQRQVAGNCLEAGTYPVEW